MTIYAALQGATGGTLDISTRQRLTAARPGGLRALLPNWRAAGGDLSRVDGQPQRNRRASTTVGTRTSPADGQLGLARRRVDGPDARGAWRARAQSSGLVQAIKLFLSA